MQKQKIICFALPVLMLFSGIAVAKISYINDYQEKEIYGKRNSDPTSNNDISKANMLPSPAPVAAICSEKGYRAKSSLGSNYICVTWDYGAVSCCKKWKCNPSTYPYTSCASGKTPTGVCNGNDGSATRYKSCS